MTPPQKKVHHGRIKAEVSQVFALAEALRGLNPAADAEVEIKMSFRNMEARVTTQDGIALASMVGSPDDGLGRAMTVTPLPPTA